MTNNNGLGLDLGGRDSSRKQQQHKQQSILLDPEELRERDIAFEDTGIGGFDQNKLVLKPIIISNQHMSFLQRRPVYLLKSPLLAVVIGDNAVDDYYLSLFSQQPLVNKSDALWDNNEDQLTLLKSKANKYFIMTVLPEDQASSATYSILSPLREAKRKIHQALEQEQELIVKPLIVDMQKKAYQQLLDSKVIQELVQLDENSLSKLEALFNTK